MQPRTLAIILTLLPILASNGAYLLSAYEGLVPWCIPYIDGCTSISRAARSGNAIFVFRATMIAYAVLLIVFWIYVKRWLDLARGQTTRIATGILWLGLVGAIALMIYIDFLGTTGEVNRFMRRYGVMLYFTLTPLAELLLLNQHYKLVNKAGGFAINPRALRFQLILLLLMLMIGIISIALGITDTKTDQSENIVEWNYSVLLVIYFAGMAVIWKDYRISFSHGD